MEVFIVKGINKNLAILLSGQFVSQVGDKFYMLALTFWVLQTTGSTIKMGTVLAAAWIPDMILGFFSGTFIDRYNRKFIIVGADLCRGAIITFVVVLYYTGMLNFYMILFSQVLLSINAAFFNTAIPAVIPQIVPEDDITTANSKHQFIQGISTIIGPMLGGIAAAAFGYLFIFTANAVSFFISGIFEMFLRIPHIQRDHQKKGSMPSKMISDMKEGYRYIFSDRALMVTLAMVGAIHFFLGSIQVIMPVIAHFLSSQGAGEGVQNLGFFQGCLGFGIIAMAGLLSIKSIGGKESKVLFGSVFIIGILFILATLPGLVDNTSVYLYFPVFILHGCFIISAATAFKSILQKGVENRLAGRVFGVVNSIGDGSVPAAMMIYAFLLNRFSFNQLLLISGLVLLPLSVISYKIYQSANYADKTLSGCHSKKS